MNLQIGVQQEVNKEQYFRIKSKWSWLIAYRKDEDKYLIKPLLFLGYKKMMIQDLLNLN